MVKRRRRAVYEGAGREGGWRGVVLGVWGVGGDERRNVRAARSLPAYVYEYTVDKHIVHSFRYSLAG